MRISRDAQQTMLEGVQDKVDRVLDNPYIPHDPTTKQWRFLLAPEREVGYGGAAGGGKSDALLMAALMYVDQPEYGALIVRETFAQLRKREGLIQRSREWLGGTDASYNKQDKTWTFPSGATLEFGYLENEGDEENYQSSAYHYIAFDELTQFREYQYRFLFRSLRRDVDSDIPLRMRSGTNPIGSGLDWVRERFIDSEDPDRKFIKATLDDNPHISTEEYERSLQALPPGIREKLRWGDNWESLGGGMYFDKDSPEKVSSPPARIERKVRFWDFAATEPNPSNPDPDYLVGVLMGEDVDGNFWVLHVERDRLPPDKVDDRIESTAESDGQEVEIVLEVEGGSQAKITVDAIARQLAGYTVETRNVSSGKEVRATPLASQWRKGHVGIKRAEWNHEYLDEMNDFPDVGHDDQVDATTGAFNYLTDPDRRTEEVNPGSGEVVSGAAVSGNQTDSTGASASNLDRFF